MTLWMTSAIRMFLTDRRVIVKTIRILLDWGQYPTWIYDDGSLIDV